MRRGHSRRQVEEINRAWLACSPKLRTSSLLRREQWYRAMWETMGNGGNVATGGHVSMWLQWSGWTASTLSHDPRLEGLEKQGYQSTQPVFIKPLLLSKTSLPGDVREKKELSCWERERVLRPHGCCLASKNAYAGGSGVGGKEREPILVILRTTCQGRERLHCNGRQGSNPNPSSRWMSTAQQWEKAWTHESRDERAKRLPVFTNWVLEYFPINVYD